MDNKMGKKFSVVQYFLVARNLIAFGVLFAFFLSSAMINGVYAAGGKKRGDHRKSHKERRIKDRKEMTSSLVTMVSLVVPSEFKYTIKDLGSPYGSSEAINIDLSLNVVVGSTMTAPQTCPARLGSPDQFCSLWRPFLYDETSGMKVITPDSETIGEAWAVSSAGLTGFMRNIYQSAPYYAFHSDLAGNIVALPGLDGTSAYGLDINDAGQIVGAAEALPDDSPHAVLWENGVVRDLGTLPNHFASYAFGINNQGRVVGVSFDLDGFTKAFAVQLDVSGAKGSKNDNCDKKETNKKNDNCENSTSKATAKSSVEPFPITELVPLDSLMANSQALDVNDNNIAVGYSDDAQGMPQAVMWDANRNVTRLNINAGVSEAIAINNSNWIIGSADGKPFLYVNNQAYTITDLLPFGSEWVIESVVGINDKGTITGTGVINGERRAFMMNLVP